MSPTVKAISQDTFDSVVKENMDEFCMDESEAVADAIEQFSSQGVKLNMIIKAAPGDGGHAVVRLTKALDGAVRSAAATDDEQVSRVLTEMADEFQKDLANRYQASKLADAEKTVYRACVRYKDDAAMLKRALLTLASLVDGQPDLIADDAVAFLLDLVQRCRDWSLAVIGLRVLKLSCTRHERNRERFVQRNGIDAALRCAESFRQRAAVVKEACACLRALTLDDDVRVAFGKAHEHTKAIVAEHRGLERLFLLIEDHERDASVASELCATLGKMMVRNEFCQQIVDLGALGVIVRILGAHLNRLPLVHKCIALINAISGNDDVKAAVVKSEALDLMLQSLARHIESAPICEATFAALATVSLRSPSHCDVIMSKRTAALVAQAMRAHHAHAGVQRQACRLVRNLVARTRHHVAAFLEKDVEALIRKARSQHRAALDDESKAALRDLNLDVDLKERWLGEKPGVTS